MNDDINPDTLGPDQDIQTGTDMSDTALQDNPDDSTQDEKKASSGRKRSKKTSLSNDGEGYSPDTSVQVVVQHPIYHTPGNAPYVPGDLLQLSHEAARHLLKAGIVRLAEGESLPMQPQQQAEGFPVFPKATPAPPAYR